MAPDYPSLHLLRLFGYLHSNLLVLLARWTQPCEKDSCLLHHLRNLLLHLQHRHVDHWRRRLAHQ